MAINVVIPLLIPLEENLHNTTRLLSGAGRDVEFTEPRYCLRLREDAPPATPVIKVTAAHKHGLAVRYSITGGNRDGLFTIHQRSGLITLAAHLDFELQAKHELVVAAEAEGRTAHSIVHVSVTDVNDNPPRFVEEDLQVTVVEEEDQHLPAVILKVEATDVDIVDTGSLVYSLVGESGDALRHPHQRLSDYFTINAHSGELIQLKALDRDPPRGRDSWKIKVQVRDGQRVPSSIAALHNKYLRSPKQQEARHAQSARMHSDSYFLSQNFRVPNAQYFHSQNSRQLRNEKDALFLDDSWSLTNTKNFGTKQVRWTKNDDLADEHVRVSKASFMSSKGEKDHSESRRNDKALNKMKGRNNTNNNYNNNNNNNNNNKATFQRKKGEFYQKRRRATEKKRKLRDKNRLSLEKGVGRDKRHKQQVGRRIFDISPRRLESPGISSHVRLSVVETEDQKDNKGYPSGDGWDPESRLFYLDDPNEHSWRLLSASEKGLGNDKKSQSRSFTRRKHQKAGGKHSLTSGRKNINKARSPQYGSEWMTENVLRTSKKHLGLLFADSQNSNETMSIHTQFFSPSNTHSSWRFIRPSKIPNSGNLNSSIVTPKSSSNIISLKNATSSTSVMLKNVEGIPNISEFAVKTQTQNHAITTSNVVNTRNERSNRDYLHNFRQDQPSDGGGCQDYETFSINNSDNGGHNVPHYMSNMYGGGTEGGTEREGESGVYGRGNRGGGGGGERHRGSGGMYGNNGGGGGGTRHGYRRGEVHVVETVVTVFVKDVNDNAPIFPNSTIYGEVQENGPIDLSVAVVSAWDADDEAEGTNARITYAIEKNVIEERSGQSIFAINQDTGLIRTAICCLDRETTPEYHIQIVATDGGGLKGSGIVVVRLADVNDNSPRLSHDVWEIEVEETWGDSTPHNTTLLHLSTLDPDISNYFFYRVVEGSGWGWQHFGVRTAGTDGELYARRTLDYEDPAHRRGFKFLVQVTDRGRGGWDDARHTDTAWVVVQLRDVNDNPPLFSRPHDHVTVREDAIPGTLISSLPAKDPDMIGQQLVKYQVVGGWGALTVDTSGGVRLWRALDREAPGGEVGIAKVVSVDDGRPPLSSTATLTVTVTDVNDCPPRLLPPTVLHITEGATPSRIGVLTATDDDVWAQGHGPPFVLSLSSSNPPHVLDYITVKYNSSLDSGRGGAEVWTLGPIDREEHRHIAVEVVVADSGGLAATHPFTVIVDDINDNPMRPASKTVYLWKMQGIGLEACLGRVYVEDPDDWDLEDKTFSWVGPPHPLFSLQADTGDIYASPQVREGRYNLQFSVSDRVWGQRDIRANVTVGVRYLPPESLAHAVPVTLTPTTPADLTKDWTPSRGGGGLGTLAAAVKTVVGDRTTDVEIVSVYGLPASGGRRRGDSFPIGRSSSQSRAMEQDSAETPPFASVWVSVRARGGAYMDPVKLQGLLALHMQQLERVMNLRVTLEDAGERGEDGSRMKSAQPPFPHNPSSVPSMASTSLPLQVVDTNSTSLVTPRLTRAHDCHTNRLDVDDTCTPTSCLNEGRCVRTDLGNRCVCPGGSWGPRCKVLARTFSGNGWAWVRPLPPCLPATLSLRVLSRSHNALLLYSGPLAPTSAHARYPATPLLLLQVVNGRPQVVIEGPRGPINLQVNTTLHSDTWHTLHLHLDTQGVTLMLDFCGRGWSSDRRNDAHCVARAAWVDNGGAESWSSSSGVPLQVGGLAHPQPHPEQFGWSAGPVRQALDGCISHLTLNGQLIDLGEPAYSSGSEGGCTPQNVACVGGCGWQGRCVGGLVAPKCECEAGWRGRQCNTPTTPTSLGHSSFSKLRLFFTPDPYAHTLQVRVRTRGRPDGLLVWLASDDPSINFSVRLRGGVACASISGMTSWASQESCVDAAPLGDGAWHTIYVARHGHNLVVSVDDGDSWRRNETLTSLLSMATGGELQAMVTETPIPLVVDMDDGTSVGGMPEFVGFKLVAVHDDLQNVCLDDLRVSGHALPLLPSINGSSWGKVRSHQQLEADCPSSDVCTNVTCAPPLSCQDTWRQATCSCGPGRQVVGSRCPDMDECVWRPCLHGGTCINLQPGYLCMCGPSHAGDNCQWVKLPPDPHPLTAPMAIAALTVSLLVIIVLGVLLTLRLHQSRTGRGSSTLRSSGVEGILPTPVGVPGVTEIPQSKHNKEENVLLESLSMRLPEKQFSVSPKDPRKGSVTGTPPSDETVTRREVNLVVPLTSTSNPDTSSRKDSGAPHTVRRCSVKTLTTCAGDIIVEKIPSISHVMSSPVSDVRSVGRPVTVCHMTPSVLPLPAQDDLRAYAYEGDGSPSGSLSSTVLGLRTESVEDTTVKPLLPEYGEVFDLLRNLPDASDTSSTQPTDKTSSCKISSDHNQPFVRFLGAKTTKNGVNDLYEKVCKKSPPLGVEERNTVDKPRMEYKEAPGRKSPAEYSTAC